MAEITTDIAQEQPTVQLPTLFDYNGNQYDFDEFEQLAYLNMDDYFKKYGKKYIKNFDDLQNDVRTILSAMREKDSSGNPRIKFYSGHIEDTKGILKNEKSSDKAIKDRMGYAAGYLIHVLSSMQPYKEPEPEVKEDLTLDIAYKALLKELFNSESLPSEAALADWWDKDLLDENTNTRKTTNRMSALIQALNNLKFEDKYNLPEGFLNYRELLNRITKDNEISSNEYADLNRIFGVTNPFPWRGLLLTDFTPLKTLPQEGEEQERKKRDEIILTPEEEIKRKELMIDKVMSNYHSEYIGKPSFESMNLPLKGLNNTKIERIKLDLSRYDDDIITGLLKDGFLGKGFGWIDSLCKNLYHISREQLVYLLLTECMRRDSIDKEKIEENKYYFPFLSGNGLGIFFDVSTGTTPKIGARPLSTIPSIRDKVWNEWINGDGKDDPYDDSYFVVSEKQGGILKALLGTGLTYNNNWDTDFINLIDWLTSPNERYRNDYYNNNLSLLHRSKQGARNTIVPNNTEYNPEKGGEYVENQDWWLNWVNALTTNEKLAKAWADRYKELELLTKGYGGETNHYKDWYGENGNFNFENFKKSTLWSDLKNGIGHDIYKGNIYFIDDNGTKKYYSKDELEGNGYVQDETYKSDLNNKLLTEYKYIKKPETETRAVEDTGETQTGTGTEDTGGNSNIIGKVGTTGNNVATSTKSAFWDKIPSLAGALTSLARPIASTVTNKKIKKDLWQQPATHNPTEEKAIETDLYPEVLQAYSNLGLSLSYLDRNQTSDASINLGAKLEGYRTGMQGVWLSLLANSEALRLSRERAYNIANKNVAEHIANANWNRDLAVATRRYNQELTANQHNKTWQSWDNFFKGIEEEWKQDKAYKKYLDYANNETNQALYKRALSNHVTNAYQDELDIAKKQFMDTNNITDIDSLDSNPNWTPIEREYNRRYEDILLNTLIGNQNRIPDLRTPMNYTDLWDKFFNPQKVK